MKAAYIAPLFNFCYTVTIVESQDKTIMQLVYIDPHSVAAVTQYTDGDKTYWFIHLKSNTYHLAFETPGENDATIERLIMRLDTLPLAVVNEALRPG